MDANVDSNRTPIGWAKADLHIHTTHSDGTATVPQLLAHVAQKTDLKVIAITDHDTIAGAQLAAKYAKDFGIEVIVGEEVSTSDGHLLALFIDRCIPPGYSAQETIRNIHLQHGIAIAPHPYDKSTPSLGNSSVRFCLKNWGLSAFEVFNAGTYWGERNANAQAQQKARTMDLAMIGASDSHSLSTVGRGYTQFRGSTAADLRVAIQNKQTTWGGSYWCAGEYAATWSRLVWQKGVPELVRWVKFNLALRASVARQRKQLG